MNDPISAIARAAADRLGREYGPALTVEVEAALHARESARQKDQYVVDPVSLGTLIVTIATLAWNIYTDLKNKTPNPAPDVLTRMVRVELRKRGDTPTSSRDEVTEIVVTEIIRTAGDS